MITSLQLAPHTQHEKQITPESLCWPRLSFPAFRDSEERLKFTTRPSEEEKKLGAAPCWLSLATASERKKKNTHPDIRRSALILFGLLPSNLAALRRTCMSVVVYPHCKCTW